MQRFVISRYFRIGCSTCSDYFSLRVSIFLSLSSTQYIFCVLQRKTLSGFISTRRLVQGISWPCCTHQFEKILLIVPFTARDFSFILYHRWNIFIMCYFRYIYIYYAYIICSIYMLYWSVDRKNFNFHWSWFSTLRMNLLGINISIVCTNARIRGAHQYTTLHCSLSNDQIEWNNNWMSSNI